MPVRSSKSLSWMNSVKVCLMIGSVLLAGGPFLFAGYDVQANAVPDVPTAFRRIAVLPSTVANGIDGLWLERLLQEKLSGRGLVVVPSSEVRKALFELGANTMSKELMVPVAMKVHVDSFAVLNVGVAGQNNYGAIATPLYGGGAIATPIETNKGSVEVSIVSAESGRLLLRGVAGGESGWRTLKGVIGTEIDLIFDKVFTPEFRVKHSQFMSHEQ